MNLFSITSLFIFISSIGFALFLYSGNRQSGVTRAWFLASGAIAFWGLALYGVTSANSNFPALIWQYLLDVSAIFIPVLYFNFVSEFLNYRNLKFRKFSLYLAIIFSLFSFTSLFKLGVAVRYGSYWIVPGKYYVLFPTFFTIYTILSLYMMVREYVKSKENFLYHAQIRNIFIAGLIGFSGGITNFFPQIFNIYPFGNYFVMLYVFFMTYGVLKYKLLNTKIISAQFFSAALVLIFFFNLLRGSESLSDWFVKLSIFILVIFFSILIVRGVINEVKQREKIESLAKDLEKSNMDLEGANERLKELDKLKSEFVSLATHQIRGPLTAIKGYVSLILEGDYGEVPPAIKEPIETIAESSQSLVVIVEDFLNVSRIEQGKMQYEISTFDLCALVNEVATEDKPTIEKKGLNISVSICPEAVNVRADRGKIKQVIGNLIDNAVKYTPKGDITITLRPDKVSKKVIVSIKDTGIGIKPEVIPYLFQRFTRAEDAAKVNILGTGLGLFVAREMVKAQGGRVWVESEGAGKGSEFLVELGLV